MRRRRIATVAALTAVLLSSGGWVTRCSNNTVQRSGSRGPCTAHCKKVFLVVRSQTETHAMAQFWAGSADAHVEGTDLQRVPLDPNRKTGWNEYVANVTYASGEHVSIKVFAEVFAGDKKPANVVRSVECRIESSTGTVLAHDSTRNSADDVAFCNYTT